MLSSTSWGDGGRADCQDGAEEFPEERWQPNDAVSQTERGEDAEESRTQGFGNHGWKHRELSTRLQPRKGLGPVSCEDRRGPQSKHADERKQGQRPAETRPHPVKLAMLDGLRAAFDNLSAL